MLRGDRAVRSALGGERIQRGHDLPRRPVIASDRDGLSATQVRDHLSRDGPNEQPRQPKRSAWRIAGEVLRAPMLCYPWSAPMC